jgi:Domain of Unknown Function (DUF1080)
MKVMKPTLSTILAALLAIQLVSSSSALMGRDEVRFTPLFNGKDFTGWVNVNCAPNTFTVRDGIIVSTGVPTGVMRTDRMYENFVLELYWRHMKPGGNAGVFVWADPITAPGTPFARAIEVQVLDGMESKDYTSHGDLFSIHGARMKPDRPHPSGWERCLPSERRAKPSPEWNHYRITARDGVLKLEVNGKEVSGGSECKPRKGYICLESEGSECHFRDIRIEELPPSGAKPEETALEAQPFRPLYTGLDLSGWRTSPEVLAQWKPENWTLECGGETPLLSEREYGDFVLVCDFRVDGKKRAGAAFLRVRGDEKSQIDLAGAPEETPAKAGEWNRSVVTLKGDRLTLVVNGKTVQGGTRIEGLAAKGPLALLGRGGKVQFANIFIREP